MTHCRNLITDVAGLVVGNAHDEELLSGVTVLIPDQAAVAAVDVRGGGPGTRETDALGLAGSVEEAHAIVLSGGSAFGLAAATGVQVWLAERGRGFAVGSARVPIVAQAVLFDLLNGGNKVWGATPPYEQLARRACEGAGRDFEVGSAGAGYGATTATLRGGLGSASEILAGGLVVGALVAVNAVGSATVGETRHFWAAPFEKGQELGGHGVPSPWPADGLAIHLKGGRASATTIAVVATNAALSRSEVHRLAVMAQTGLARALYPVHTPLDGDTVFAIATGEAALPDPHAGLAGLGTAAANALARAVARGVYEAAPAPRGWIGPPAWRTRFQGSA
jgi:L-aminopeptidase/D-esterase-like protein